jgi:transposase
MIRATIPMQISVCTQPTDMRRSFDGLSGMVRQVLSQDPLSDPLFLFRNRARDRLKILCWD